MRSAISFGADGAQETAGTSDDNQNRRYHFMTSVIITASASGGHSMSSRSFAAILALLSMSCGVAQTAVSDKPETPFKLATYEGRVGLVLGETILDIGAANEHLVREAGLPALEIPTEMRALIEGYDRVKPRLYQMANFFNGKTDGLAFAKDIASAKIEAPIQYPWNLLMAAANYQSHAAEMNTAVNVDIETDFPFLFAKSPRSCIIGTGATYFIPKG